MINFLITLSETALPFILFILPVRDFSWIENHVLTSKVSKALKVLCPNIRMIKDKQRSKVLKVKSELLMDYMCVKISIKINIYLFSIRLEIFKEIYHAAYDNYPIIATMCTII